MRSEQKIKIIKRFIFTLLGLFFITTTTLASEEKRVIFKFVCEGSESDCGNAFYSFSPIFNLHTYTKVCQFKPSDIMISGDDINGARASVSLPSRCYQDGDSLQAVREYVFDSSTAMDLSVESGGHTYVDCQVPSAAFQDNRLTFTARVRSDGTCSIEEN